jgi:KRAB domain-containing zinc finger protein
MEVEDDTGAKRQAYKIKKRFIPCLTTCAMCGLRSDTVKANSEHWAKAHGDRVIEYKCLEFGGQCEFKTSSIMNMKLHTKEHMFKEGLMDQCPMCNKYFAKRQMKAHLAVHNGGPQFSCKECGKMFKFKSGLQTHQKTHDPNYTHNLFTCAECGKEYSMKHQYDAHVRRHTEVRPYRCEICLKAFWSPHDLQYHETIHTGLRPFKCTHCDMSFARDLDRKKHFVVKHTEPNKYACSICPVKYNRKDQLLVHELNHRGETPFKCEVCSKGFTRKDKLTRHMDVHVTDDSKYRFSCHLCGKRYTQSGSLFTHMKNSHNGVQ